jgi:hypothetical protein
VNFTADYSAITVAPGDVVKVTNAGYGFNNKLFRVLKTTQDMDDDILVINVTLLEWNLAIFKERIPYKKPALDDIAFEPETYTDNTDGGGIRPDSTPGTALANGAVSGGKIGSNTVASINLTTTGVTAGTYGAFPGQGFVVDAAGRILSAILSGSTATTGAINNVGLGSIAASTGTYTQIFQNTYLLTEADAGKHMMQVQSAMGGTFYAGADHLLTHPLEKGVKANVVVKYEGNGTVIYTDESTNITGSNSNNYIDVFGEPGATPVEWEVGTAAYPVNWATAGDVSFTLTYFAFINYNGGTVTNMYAAGIYDDSGPIRSFT